MPAAGPAPAPAASTEAVLRTLAPLLRTLERKIRGWLDAKHFFPRDLMTTAALEGLVNDLHRQADALDVEQPLLVVMLMGGTGVGKSTLLNALAGGAVANASFQRPTTKDPVVYYHDSVKPEKFDAQLRTCRLMAHDRPALQHKVLVDLPDLDSNVVAHRETVRALLPVSDVVLFVGSQEKYHDSLMWDEFLKQRQRHAFAFVMNKWDRCLHNIGQGIRPDEDLARDLKAQGFENPLIFRTNAQHWVDKANGETPATVDPPAGEQFLDLVNWLESGLNRLEVEAIKSRGITQMLQHLQQALEKAAPPDLAEAAARTRVIWEKTVGDEAIATSEILLSTLDPYQSEIEHHFSVQSQRHFRGLMAGYLTLIAKLRHSSSSLKKGISILPRVPIGGTIDTPAQWDLQEFTRSLSSVAGERQLDARGKALADKLLLQGQDHGFPLTLLQERTENAAKIDWRGRYAQTLVDVLTEVEQQWSQPTGLRRWVHNIIIILGNILPPVVLLGSYGFVFWHIFVTGDYPMQITQLVAPLAATLVVMIALQVLILLVLPLRWLKIRGEFHTLLDDRLRKALVSTYGPIPADLAGDLGRERKQVEDLGREVREVYQWLDKREKTNVGILYGK